MPRIWLDYCQFLINQCKITKTRLVFDRALRALPITQHHRIWPLYITFLKSHDIPETAVRVFRRYLKVNNFNLNIDISFLNTVCSYIQLLLELRRRLYCEIVQKYITSSWMVKFNKCKFMFIVVSRGHRRVYRIFIEYRSFGRGSY
jgi:hypothetical protein